MSTALASPGRDRKRTPRPVVVAWGLWVLALTANLLTYVFFVVPDPTRLPAIETFDWITGWLPFMVFPRVYLIPLPSSRLRAPDGARPEILPNR